LLSGTPTEVAASTAYTITATNATSSTTQTFTLTVTAVPVAPNDADNSAAQAAQAEAARRANEQRQMGDLSSVLPLINELIKEIEDGFKSTSAPKKKSSTSKTKQSSQAKPEKKSNSEPLTIPIPPATEPEAQSQVGELVSVSHKVGFGLSASWINSSNIKALRGFIAGIEESFEVERIVIQGYAQPTKIGLSDIDIARAKAVKKFLSKEGLDYPMIVEGMGQAKSKKGDLSRLAVVTVEGKLKNQN
jgi:outer membrane protein OmpA-like peptidoglycan-associated protein